MQPNWDRLQRIIVGLVALIALGSLAAGAGLYAYLNREALRDARDRVEVAGREVAARLDGLLAEHARAAANLAGDSCSQRALLAGGAADLADANNVLDLCSSNFGAEVCYLIDRRGLVVASSNRADPDSFVGQSYAFRPYFRAALAGRPAVYAAQGVTSLRRGIYFSHPVAAGADGEALGVVVIKSGAERLERSFPATLGDAAVVDAEGMVLLSNRPEWRLRPLWSATPEQQRRWRESRQFGLGPFAPLGMRRRGEVVVSPADGTYRPTSVAIPAFPGWELVLLVDEAAITAAARRRTLLPGALILLLCLTLSGGGWYFVRWGRAEVALRTRAEAAREALIGQLRESLAQVRTLEGLLPICSRCRKIRDEGGAWQQMETYVHERTDARFTHGLCPDCQAVLFPGVRPRAGGGGA